MALGIAAGAGGSGAMKGHLPHFIEGMKNDDASVRARAVDNISFKLQYKQVSRDDLRASPTLMAALLAFFDKEDAPREATVRALEMLGDFASHPISARLLIREGAVRFLERYRLRTCGPGASAPFQASLEQVLTQLVTAKGAASSALTMLQEEELKEKTDRETQERESRERQSSELSLRLRDRLRTGTAATAAASAATRGGALSFLQKDLFLSDVRVKIAHTNPDIALVGAEALHRCISSQIHLAAFCTPSNPVIAEAAELVPIIARRGRRRQAHDAAEGGPLLDRAAAAATRGASASGADVTETTTLYHLLAALQVWVEQVALLEEARQCALQDGDGEDGTAVMLVAVVAALVNLEALEDDLRAKAANVLLQASRLLRRSPSATATASAAADLLFFNSSSPPAPQAARRRTVSPSFTTLLATLAEGTLGLVRRENTGPCAPAAILELEVFSTLLGGFASHLADDLGDAGAEDAAEGSREDTPPHLIPVQDLLLAVLAEETAEAEADASKSPAAAATAAASSSLLPRYPDVFRRLTDAVDVIARAGAACTAPSANIVGFFRLFQGVKESLDVSVGAATAAQRQVAASEGLAVVAHDVRYLVEALGVADDFDTSMDALSAIRAVHAVSPTAVTRACLHDAPSFAAAFLRFLKTPPANLLDASTVVASCETLVLLLQSDARSSRSAAAGEEVPSCPPYFEPLLHACEAHVVPSLFNAAEVARLRAQAQGSAPSQAATKELLLQATLSQPDAAAASLRLVEVLLTELQLLGFAERARRFVVETGIVDWIDEAYFQVCLSGKDHGGASRSVLDWCAAGSCVALLEKEGVKAVLWGRGLLTQGVRVVKAALSVLVSSQPSPEHVDVSQKVVARVASYFNVCVTSSVLASPSVTHSPHLSTLYGSLANVVTLATMHLSLSAASADEWSCPIASTSCFPQLYPTPYYAVQATVLGSGGSEPSLSVASVSAAVEMLTHGGASWAASPRELDTRAAVLKYLSTAALSMEVRPNPPVQALLSELVYAPLFADVLTPVLSARRSPSRSAFLSACLTLAAASIRVEASVAHVSPSKPDCIAIWGTLMREARDVLGAAAAYPGSSRCPSVRSGEVEWVRVLWEVLSLAVHTSGDFAAFLLDFAEEAKASTSGKPPVVDVVGFLTASLQRVVQDGRVVVAGAAHPALASHVHATKQSLSEVRTSALSFVCNVVASKPLYVRGRSAFLHDAGMQGTVLAACREMMGSREEGVTSRSVPCCVVSTIVSVDPEGWRAALEAHAEGLAGSAMLLMRAERKAGGGGGATAASSAQDDALRSLLSVSVSAKRTVLRAAEFEEWVAFLESARSSTSVDNAPKHGATNRVTTLLAAFFDGFGAADAVCVDQEGASALGGAMVSVGRGLLHLLTLYAACDRVAAGAASAQAAGGSPRRVATQRAFVALLSLTRAFLLCPVAPADLSSALFQAVVDFCVSGGVAYTSLGVHRVSREALRCLGAAGAEHAGRRSLLELAGTNRKAQLAGFFETLLWEVAGGVGADGTGGGGAAASVAAGEVVASEWTDAVVKTLAELAFSAEGKAFAAQVPGLFEVLFGTLQTQGLYAVAQQHCMVLVRNLAFRKQNKMMLARQESVVTCVKEAIASTSSSIDALQQKWLALSCLWSLIHNCEKAKSHLKQQVKLSVIAQAKDVTEQQIAVERDGQRRERRSAEGTGDLYSPRALSLLEDSLAQLDTLLQLLA
eukprot:Rhum_TRINITY_DN11340_c0_g2::Rhum_TRINITY_DN11340_c0_g2_i1::g.44083::m.44083